MDLQAVPMMALFAACIALTAWTTFRVTRGRATHWAWRALSVPASWMAAIAVITLVGMGLGWSGEQVLRSMTAGSFAYMLSHAALMGFGSRWFGSQKDAAPATGSATPKSATGSVSRVSITLFGEEKDAPALEVRARTVGARAREAMPGVQVEVIVSDNLLAEEAGYPVISADGTEQEQRAVEAIVQPILRSTP
jgi:hypothetical protein